MKKQTLMASQAQSCVLTLPAEVQVHNAFSVQAELLSSIRAVPEGSSICLELQGLKHFDTAVLAVFLACVRERVRERCHS